MAIRVTSFTIQSNFPNDNSVYIANITSTIASATVESDVAISSVKFLFVDGQGASLVDATLSQGVWTATRANQIAYNNATVSIQVIDTDGNRFQGYVRTYTVKAHAIPTVSIDAFRCDQNGDRDMDGGYVSMAAWADSDPTEIGIRQLVVRLEDELGNIIDSVGNVTNGTRYILGNGNVDPDERYTLEAWAEDNYGEENNATEPFFPVNRIINVKDEGTGIAFGKKCTADERLQSAWQIDCDKGIHAMKTLYCDYESETVNRGNAVALTTTGTANMFTRTSLLQFSVDSSTGEMLNRYEQYRYPVVEQDMTANAVYDLVTSKDTRIAYTSIANGGTNRYTIANNSRHFVLIIGSGVTNNYAVFMFACTSSGSATQRQISKGSGITVSTSGTTISITSTGAAATVMDWAILGANLEVTT